MRILLFPLDTQCPMPHGYWVRTRRHLVVKLWKMQPWEDELWQVAIEAVARAEASGIDHKRT